MAAKLAGMSEDNQLLVSDRYYKKLQSDLVRLSCGCGSENGEKKLLWEEIDIANDDKFDFDRAYSLKSSWCPTHGKEYCENILVLDDE
ncbi:MAG TPA: hypothetical protein PKC29_14750 [Thermodesulfobacteriota bacterium]|nr:hypothetical protein [Thermodesulfobacteriota bacterium]